MLAVVTTGAVGPEVYALAAGVIVLAVGCLAIGALVVTGRGWLPTEDVDFTIWTGILAAGLSLGAAAIHFAVIGEHYAEYPPYGVAFIVFAWFQVGWAVRYVVHPRRALARLAIVVNVGAIVVWVVSRVIGLPLGPEPGATEPVGPLDLVAAALELALIALLAWDLAAGSERSRPRLSPTSAVVYLGSAILAIVVVTSAAFVLGGTDGHAAEAHVHAAPTTSADSSAKQSPGPLSPAPESASPAPPVPAGSPAKAGSISFGSSLDLAGQIQGPTASFRPGQTAIWLAHLLKAPGTPTIRFIIVQVLPDGREIEHWRQDMTVADPGGRLLVGMADLSIYVHGGAGSYRMRYFRGDELLAEGAFEFAE